MDDAHGAAGPSTSSSTWPSPPAYDFGSPPRAAAALDAAKVTERSFFRSARWYVSPNLSQYL